MAREPVSKFPGVPSRFRSLVESCIVITTWEKFLSVARRSRDESERTEILREAHVLLRHSFIRVRIFVRADGRE